MPATQALMEEVENVFPWVEKPQGESLSFHETGCLQCEFVRSDLAVYSDKELPVEAIRYIHQEMPCLSALGWRWVLPSYLRHCLTQEPDHDYGETSFLIYNLAPEPKYEAETRERLSALSTDQINCLLHFVEWCKEHPYWSDFCPNEIALAYEFLQSLKVMPNVT